MLFRSYWGLRNVLIDNLRAIRSSIEASGNLSGGISGGISGTWADKESELDRELHKLNTNGVPYSNDAEQAQRSNLAERYFELWKAMGDYNNGHHYLHDAYRMCKVIGYYTSTVPVGTDD